MKRYYSMCLLLIAFSGVAAAQILPGAVLMQTYSYPPVGVVSGQALRVSLGNASDSGSACMANLSFVNSDGTAVKNEDVSVDPSKSVSYVLQFSDVPGIAATATAQVRAVVKVQRPAIGIIVSPGPGLVPSCTAVTSVELVDVASGQTRVLLASPAYVSGLLPILVSAPPTAQ
jgi:hypothetical protein